MKPIAITIGDPAGIGPETIVAGWHELDELARKRCVVIGRASYLEHAANCLGRSVNLHRVASVEEELDSNAINYLEVGQQSNDSIELGKLSAAAGEVAYQAIIEAGKLTIEDKVAAMVTAPINKQALRMAGYEFPGHTELLADLCGIDHVNMMLYLGKEYVPNSRVGLGVVHTTLHTALRQALDDLSGDLILKAGQRISQFFQQLLDNDSAEDHAARIAVAALNPHGGEQGLFGDEESTIISPTIEQGRSNGLLWTGPFPCDTLMARSVQGEFDGVVAMYHDQGHIAFKLLNMHRAVNVTLGLPIVRTSAAHGTAFALAGKGVADYGGLLESIKLADKLSASRD